MNCHICHQPAIGQCQACWKFYCQAHGDVLCQPCQQQRDAAREQSGGGTLTLLGTSSRDPQARSRRGLQPPELDAQTLRRVIGVAQTAEHGETELDLLSLELYDAGFIANFRLRGTPAGQPTPGPFGMMRHPEFSPQATDDLGNTYDGWQRGGGGSHRGWRAAMHFSPAPPAQARTLRFTVVEIRWLAHGPGQRSTIEPGPWEFQVEL